jgi:uncharacterized protein YebE (UPF0316 family)
MNVDNFLWLLLGAFIIMCLRIIDVSLGTIRTINMVQGRKYNAGLFGFFESLIWIIAIRHIMQNLDNLINILGYATGFALGNVIGITIEQKIGSGFIQLSIISLHYADPIADRLRQMNVGVTMLPGEGGSGGVAVIQTLIPRKRHKEIINTIKSIDPKAFITVHSTVTPYGGYITNRK